MIKLDRDDKVICVCKYKSEHETIKNKKNNERRTANIDRNKRRDN